MANVRETIVGIDRIIAEAKGGMDEATRDFIAKHDLGYLATALGGGSPEPDAPEAALDEIETPIEPKDNVPAELHVPYPRKQPERVGVPDLDKALAHIQSHEQLSDWQRREIVRTAAAHFVESVKNGRIIRAGIDEIEACVNHLVDGKGQSTALCVRVVERIASGDVDGFVKLFLSDDSSEGDEEPRSQPQPQPKHENLPDQSATRTPEVIGIFPTLITEEEAERLTGPSHELLQQTADGKFSLGNREAYLLLRQKLDKRAMDRIHIPSSIYHILTADFIFRRKEHFRSMQAKKDVKTALERLRESMRDGKNYARVKNVPRLPMGTLNIFVGHRDNKIKSVESVREILSKNGIDIPVEYIKRLLAVALIEYSRP
jgi:hypothetical protein